ncbi:MAG: beta-galactosidase [Planctomycetota bacterium]
MPEVRIENGALCVGSERVPFFAGEVHYWRLNPARWRTVLESVRKLGLDVVATYVPWEYHELAPEQFDFTGATDPARNLVGFLDLLHELKFWVFIRPGPYIYAEWTNAGVPDRVVGLPRIGAEYRREAEVWMRAVIDVLRPYFAGQGGRIVLFQPDNEMDLFSHWFEDEAGLSGAGAGFFHDFLRGAYCDVAELNAAWGTSYERFEEAQPLAERPNGFDPHALARHADYWRFQHWATAEGLRWHAETYRELGVDLPMLANYYPGGDVQNWRAVARTVDCTGIDWYPRSEFAGALPYAGQPRGGMTGGGASAASGAVSEHRRFLDTCRYQRTVSPLPCLAEFECGVWHGYHEYTGVLTPNHYRLAAFSALLAGIQAWDWYMLVGRDNWYYCPVNERGDLRAELAEVFMRIHSVVRECDPPSLRKLTRTAVFVDPVQVATDRIFTTNPLLDALYAADIDYEVVDAESPALERRAADAVGESAPSAAPSLLFYAAADWLPQASIARLGDYVERGGTLVVFQGAFPQRNETFHPCSGLAIAPPDRILSRLGKKVAVELASERPIAEGAVWNWDRPPGEPIWCTQIAGTQQALENADAWMKRYIGRRWTCGYRQRRGAGALVVLGMPPNPGLLRGIHRWLGVPAFAQAELPGVLTALFARGDARWLYAANMNDQETRTRVMLDVDDLPAAVRVTDLWTGSAQVVSPESLTIRLPRRSGGAWRVETAR